LVTGNADEGREGVAGRDEQGRQIAHPDLATRMKGDRAMTTEQLPEETPQPLGWQCGEGREGDDQEVNHSVRMINLVWQCGEGREGDDYSGPRKLDHQLS
jgi:hypothetical protein